MKKLIHAFLKVGFILAIVFVALGVLFIPLAFIPDNEVNRATMIAYGIVFLVFGIANLVGLIIVRQKWDAKPTKEEARPIAVWSIVLGALLTGFPIAAGILMLVMPEDQYEKKE